MPSIIGVDDFNYVEGDGVVIIDNDITIQDDNTLYSDGSIKVSGHSADENIWVNSVGSAAGQISVSDNNVSYGGLVIATLTGGDSGTDLVINLNEDATTPAIEALLENLTYENTSDTPDTSSGITISLFSADESNSLVASYTSVFVRQPEHNDPVSHINAGQEGAPTFVDIDNDGDLDIFVGSLYGVINYYENTGTVTEAVYTLRTDEDHPLNDLEFPSRPTPTFVDIDNDGDMDLVTGGLYGKVFYYENIGDAENPTFESRSVDSNPFHGFDVGDDSAPTFGDIDNDGDLDLVIGSDDGRLFYYYENTGDAENPDYTLRAGEGSGNPFYGIDVGDKSVPVLADIDDDGDLDLVVGNNSGLIYYENTGDVDTPVFTLTTGSVEDPFDAINLFHNGKPVFADLNNDGDMELVFGQANGDIQYYENKGNSFSISITAINDIPTASDATITVYEDREYTYFGYRDFGYYDPETRLPVSFRIDSLPELGTFKLDETTITVGDIIELADITSLSYTPEADGEGVGYASFTFSVYDGTAWSETPNTLTIDVSNRNDAPTAITMEGDGTIDENTAGASLGVLSATDIDDTAHTFSVNDSRFEIVDGVLKLKDTQRLDYDTDGPTIDVTITAIDSGNARASEVITISINENAAPTVTSLASGSVIEGETLTLDIDATDTEGDALTYSISGTDAAQFTIDSDTGQISFRSAPDFETPTDTDSDNVYDLTVSVSDETGSSTQDVTIEVTDKNEAPSAVTITDQTDIAENVEAAIVASITATDLDADNILTFAVSDSRFEVIDGKLKLKPGISLDYEENTSIEITVTASDSEGLSVSETITVTVTDIEEIVVVPAPPAEEEPEAVDTSGPDELEGSAGEDELDGGRGNDMLDGGRGDDLLKGGAGSDRLKGGSGSDKLVGGKGADTLLGGKGVDTADYTNSGKKVVIDLANDIASGGHAKGDTLKSIENLVGSDGEDKLYGDDVNNKLEGGAGNDKLLGRKGDDKLYGGAGHDTISGGAGKDKLSGGKGDDTLLGGKGVDKLTGGKGDDILKGGSKADTLAGGAGKDALNGGKGDDTLIGGKGDDTFIFDGMWGHDTINDFVDGTDMIDMSDSEITFDDLVIIQNGDDTLIADIAGNSITLLNTVSTNITASDFIFEG